MQPKPRTSGECESTRYLSPPQQANVREFVKFGTRGLLDFQLVRTAQPSNLHRLWTAPEQHQIAIMSSRIVLRWKYQHIKFFIGLRGSPTFSDLFFFALHCTNHPTTNNVRHKHPTPWRDPSFPSCGIRNSRANLIHSPNYSTIPSIQSPECDCKYCMDLHW